MSVRVAVGTERAAGAIAIDAVRSLVLQSLPVVPPRPVREIEVVLKP